MHAVNASLGLSCEFTSWFAVQNLLTTCDFHTHAPSMVHVLHAHQEGSSCTLIGLNVQGICRLPCKQ